MVCHDQWCIKICSRQQMPYTEAVEGVLHAAENAAAPFDSTGHRRLIACERRRIFVAVEDFPGKIDFTAELVENIHEFAHHLFLYSSLGLNFLEVQEQLKCALRRTQFPEAGINQLPCCHLWV